MVDRLVCADPELARADQQMAWAYADALKFAPGRRVGLISDQRAWLAGRVTFEARKQSYDTCFITAPSAPTPDERLCLKQHYKERRDQLLRDVFVEPDTLVGDHADYARLMSHGEALLLGAVEVRCTPDRVQIFFGSTREGLKDIYGRGDREARWIDCPIGGGHRIRFKIGDQFPPQPYGECGASPAQIFSVWRDRRKLIEARDAGEECFGWKLHSATVTATGVETCAAVGKPEWLIEPGKPGRKAAPKKGPCVTSKVEGTRDKAAFSDLPPDILIAQPSKELGALCGRFINPKDLTKVAVPADVRRPAWVSGWSWAAPRGLL